MSAANCILVVDDDFQIRRALKNALREVAERVIEAESGSEGLADLAATQHPDLVVLDLGLPDMRRRRMCVAKSAASQQCPSSSSPRATMKKTKSAS